MSLYSVDSSSLSDIGDLLREQLNEQGTQYKFPDDFKRAITDIGLTKDIYDGITTVTPSELKQELSTKDKIVQQNIVVNPIPSEYIIPTGAEVISVTENGTVSKDVTSKETVTVNVDVPTFVELTQEEYDALPTKDPDTLYVIMEGET